MSGWRPGTVVRYTPERLNRWCREGTAIADARGCLVDTYWGGGGSEAHILTVTEGATAEVLFNIYDYRELDRHARATWRDYHPDDRRCVTSQHGLQQRLFVRPDAKPDLDTKITNARDAVRDAEQEVASAESALKWRRDELARLEATR